MKSCASLQFLDGLLVALLFGLWVSIIINCGRELETVRTNVDLDQERYEVVNTIGDHLMRGGGYTHLIAEIWLSLRYLFARRRKGNLLRTVYEIFVLMLCVLQIPFDDSYYLFRLGLALLFDLRLFLFLLWANKHSIPI